MSMKTLILFLLLAYCIPMHAQLSAADRVKHFNTEKKVAIQGYDAVAYFANKKPIKGKASLAVNHQGIVYYFATEANKKVFIASPNQYEPQYGGWCAFAMGDNGKKVEVNPETFKIIDGKLYLFYNAYFNNTLTSWNKNEKALKTKAEANWKKFITK
jgi:YHS domain-containing protein